MELYFLAAFFFTYGVLGWCVEVAYAAVRQGKFVNRGFLNGPICPIYGVGVLSVLYCLRGVTGSLPVLYVTSVALVTLIEGMTGFVMDRLFHHKWWDYSKRPLNIGGYVCLRFSLVWGVFCVFIMKVFHPAVREMAVHMPFLLNVPVLAACLAVLSVDVYVTVAAILKMNRRFEAMERIAAELRELSDKMGENIYENVRESMEREERIKEKVGQIRESGKEFRAERNAELHARYEQMRTRREELRSRYEGMLRDRGAVFERLLKAFPGMESRKYRKALRELKEHVRRK